MKVFKINKTLHQYLQYVFIFSLDILVMLS